MGALDEDALWKAARTRVSARKAARLAALHRRRGRGEALSEAENAEVRRLVRECERVMLVRAQAAVLLKERGYDIAGLGPRK